MVGVESSKVNKHLIMKVKLIISCLVCYCL